MGTTIDELLAIAFPNPPFPIMAAVVDNQYQSLGFRPQADITLQPVDFSSSEGMRVYQRSVSLVLVVAMHELYPAIRLLIDHSVPNGGFYCELLGHAPLTSQELALVEARMRDIVSLDEPITCEMLSLAEARLTFAQQGFQDKVSLLGFTPDATIPTYVLRGIRDSFYGLMTSRTGSLRWFSLRVSDNGFILYLPQPHNPIELPPAYERTKIIRVFRDYGRWLNILGIDDISSLNSVIEQKRIREVILVSEALHERNIAALADQILTSKGTARIVLIAGPSSSGKTTFARRLAIQLRVSGLKPYALGLDDYFVDRELTPRDEHSEYDYEAFEAINCSLFNEQIVQLLHGKIVALRKYDFLAGRGYAGRSVQLPTDAILIVEGIHGLNPRLLTDELRAQTFRLYISALAQLNIDDHNRVPTADSRLLRRIVRDAQFRGYSAGETLARWESVRHGEERNIFPYQETADALFNSALVYELAVLKPFAESLLSNILPNTAIAREAQRLLTLLQWVRPCLPDLVPDNSLLREFIGGSILEDFGFQWPSSTA
ncbi:MAG: uridine kinase family protein [Anaerolineae bacterium]